MEKRVILVILILCLIPFANAFTFLGINWGSLWDKIIFWDDDNIQSVTNQTNIRNVHAKTKVTDFTFLLANVTYSASQLANSINNNEELKGYIKSFGYSCIYLSTDKGLDLTLNFDTQTGKITKIKQGNSCDHNVYIEESLISDIQKNGFEAKNTRVYLEKVDLDWGMYMKALKVFTVG